MKLKTIIVDDEIGAQEALESIVLNYPEQLELVGIASSINDATKLMIDKKPQLVFLDMHINDRSGFDLLRNNFDFHFEVIIVSAYDQYALRAFDNEVISYLLKPVNFTAFEKAIERAKTVLSGSNTSTSSGNTSPVKIQLPIGNNIELVALKDVVFVRADGSYCSIHLVNGSRLTISKPLRFVEDQDSEEMMLRAHRSYLVNKDHIVSFSRSDKPFVVLSGKQQIPVSKVGKSAILEHLERTK